MSDKRLRNLERSYRVERAEILADASLSWAASEKRYNARRERELRLEWREQFLHLAAVHEWLAKENRLKAVRLVGGA